jgi:hypothetical protein
MISVTVSCLPAAVSLLLLVALFMHISVVSLALTWPFRLCFQSSPVCEPLLQAFPFPRTLGKVTLHPLSQACVFIYSSCGRCVFPPVLWSFPPTATFTSFPAPDYWVVLLLLPAAMFVYSSHEKWVFPLLLWSFPPLSQAFPLLVAGCALCSHQSLCSPPGLACLFTVLGRIPFPQSSALRVTHPLSRVSLLFLLLISHFLFFPQVEVSLSRGLCCSGPGLSVGVP